MCRKYINIYIYRERERGGRTGGFFSSSSIKLVKSDLNDESESLKFGLPTSDASTCENFKYSN